ncbi:MAG: DUF2088 domain-containing protein, partial [Desulfobacula sp.]|nr:DUF2088 domain-containing protein [Desulfobacula sp.]
MKINVPYDKDSSMSAVIDDAINVKFLEANDVEIGDEDKNIQVAINAPINSKNFKEFLNDAKKVLVIV